MQAYGSDRLREADDGRLIVSSRLDKGWVPRTEKTLTSAEFPGTAILWENQYFEVVSSEMLPAAGVRYVLEPWREHHVMRVTENYDEASEARRLEEHRKRLLREKHRKTANALGIFTGHLPKIVQETLASDLGILPKRLTLLSTFFVLAVIVALVMTAVGYTLRRETIPLPLSIAIIYLSIENVIRWGVVWMVGQPIGSSIGTLAYILYWGITRRGVSPFASAKGSAVPITEAPPDVAARDAYAMREALITLLTPAEQAVVAQRFGYDYRRESRVVAIGILFFAVIGMATSWTTRNIIALGAALFLAVEQVIRLAAFPRGPAGSVLRVLVRPFVRKLLV